MSTVVINEEVIRRYVESQEEEETGQAKLELSIYIKKKDFQNLYRIYNIVCVKCFA